MPDYEFFGQVVQIVQIVVQAVAGTEVDVAVAAVVTPLGMAVDGLEVEMGTVLDFAFSHKGTPEKVHYRSPVTSHLRETERRYLSAMFSRHTLMRYLRILHLWHRRPHYLHGCCLRRFNMGRLSGIGRNI